jgi:hypothetical protein
LPNGLKSKSSDDSLRCFFSDQLRFTSRILNHFQDKEIKSTFFRVIDGPLDLTDRFRTTERKDFLSRLRLDSRETYPELRNVKKYDKL